MSGRLLSTQLAILALLSFVPKEMPAQPEPSGSMAPAHSGAIVGAFEANSLASS